MPLDEYAKKMLQELDKAPSTVDSLATKCAGGSSRMVSPRVVWLEGLGLIESIGGGSYTITHVGKVLLELVS